MIAVRSPWWRLISSASAFLIVFLAGFLGTVLLLYSHEVLLGYWMDGLSVFNKVGLFEYRGGGEEGRDEAVGNSLACLWLPLAALAAWQLNRWLKRPE